ncbi:MAG: L-carnitine dehydratase/bile acid-inducible protein, partial [Rhizorhabdus sp.]|nr:L-carnitine dehydratase/bile acid-inducible protein [Rhizorhabdus sp.]
ELAGLDRTGPPVIVDRRLSSLWFGWSIRPIGWTMAAAWDPIAGDYRAADGWIKLHTNAPRHRAAALSVLGCEPTRETVARAVARWNAQDLESAVVTARGCAAAMRTADAWQRHPQGMAVNAEPLIAIDRGVAGPPSPWRPQPDRPLRGIRVLDLTRILAGPVATRFLAGFGADVLRVDPPEWDEPAITPDVTLGKRCVRLDLRDKAGRAKFERLLAGADVLVHGYRLGALDALGYDSEAREAIRPGLIDVSLNAYGHEGPWSSRRGFDSLVQMSCGIADTGMNWRQADQPCPLPVQALDQATGYLMAAAAVRGIHEKVRSGTSLRARLSLARTAKLLMDHRPESISGGMAGGAEADHDDAIERTPWGPARRLRPPASVEDAALRWDLPAAELGSGIAEWAA